MTSWSAARRRFCPVATGTPSRAQPPARSVPDARDIGDSLTDRGVSLALGTQIYDPADPMGKMFFNILATFAEFEVDLLRMRTREGMAVARSKGKLKGRQPKLSPKRQTELKKMHDAGEHSIADLAEIFDVGVALVTEQKRQSAHWNRMFPTIPGMPCSSH